MMSASRSLCKTPGVHRGFAPVHSLTHEPGVRHGAHSVRVGLKPPFLCEVQGMKRLALAALSSAESHFRPLLVEGCHSFCKLLRPSSSVLRNSLVCLSASSPSPLSRIDCMKDSFALRHASSHASIWLAGAFWSLFDSFAEEDDCARAIVWRIRRSQMAKPCSIAA